MTRGGEDSMTTYSHQELDDAFRTYWRTGAVGEDWDAWADLFTEDCTYFEHYYGAMQGREVVRAWIKPVMARYGEIYTAYEWHTIDVERGRVIFYMPRPWVARSAPQRFVRRERQNSQLRHSGM